MLIVHNFISILISFRYIYLTNFVIIATHEPHFDSVFVNIGIFRCCDHFVWSMQVRFFPSDLSLQDTYLVLNLFEKVDRLVETMR